MAGPQLDGNKEKIISILSDIIKCIKVKIFEVIAYGFYIEVAWRCHKFFLREIVKFTVVIPSVILPTT